MSEETKPPEGDEGMGHYLRDMVYGATDGIITTFSVVAGVAGANLDHTIIIILGIANLVSDGLSMAASNYLGMKSDIDRLGLSVHVEKPERHGLATFLAFVVAGAFPLMPYLIPAMADENIFAVSVVGALGALAMVGGLRSFFTGKSFWRSALEMLFIGGAAGSLAYGIGAGLAGLVT